MVDHSWQSRFINDVAEALEAVLGEGREASRVILGWVQEMGTSWRRILYKLDQSVEEALGAVWVRGRQD
jgi:hypothetical protein